MKAVICLIFIVLSLSTLNKLSARLANMDKDFEQKRKEMVDYQLLARGINNQLILKAMNEVPRHKFVLPDLQEYSYLDSALPIASGQTISQPFIVAFMCEQASLTKNSRILEIGTGSG